MRQDVFTTFAQDIGRRAFQALQQGLIGLEDAEVRVVRQNQILDGIEGIHPLPLRAQHLLQQTQILRRNPQCLRRRFQEVQFFPGMAPATGGAERQQADHRLFAQHRQQDHVMNAMLPQLFLLRFGHLGAFHDHGAVVVVLKYVLK